MMPETTEKLDHLLAALERRLERTSGTTDALDLILAAPPRQTSVRALRNDPVVEAFRRELTDGLIRVDTANRLLELLSTVIGVLTTP